MNLLARIFKRRKERQDFDEYTALIATPGDLAAGIILPAAGTLYASTSVTTTDVTPLVTVKDVAYNVPNNTPAGQPFPVCYGENLVTVKKHASAPGTVILYVRDGLDNLCKIAEG